MVRSLAGARRRFAAALVVLGAASCETVGDQFNPSDLTGIPRFPNCDVDPDLLFAAAGRDAIRALDDAVWQWAADSIPGYLDPDSRVIGLEVLGQSYAVPHNVLWYHEIVNLELNRGGPTAPQLAITYCPLTGSSLVLDRAAVGNAPLGVSGILFMNNLSVFDRSGSQESVFPQLLGEAICGARVGVALDEAPFIEMQWAAWLQLHPETQVLAQDQGFDPVLFDYTWRGYPYGHYRVAEDFFVPQIMPPPDPRRHPKERVVGVRSTGSDPGIAFPFEALGEAEGAHQAIDFAYEGAPAVLLWSDDAVGGAAFRPITEDGAAVTIGATEEGLVDAESGSLWTVDGRAVSGAMAGSRLVPVVGSHTAFWGAWTAFNPTTRLWS